MQQIITAPECEVDFDGPESQGHDRAVGVNAKDQRRVDEFLTPSSAMGEFSWCRGVLITGDEDETRKVEIISKSADLKGYDFADTDISKSLTSFSLEGINSAEKSALSIIDFQKDDKLVFCINGLETVFAKPKNMYYSENSQRLACARGFASLISDILADRPNLRVCAPVDFPKNLPASLKDADVFGAKVRIDVPKAQARREALSAIISGAIFSNMFVGEGPIINISDSNWLDALTDSTSKMTYGQIRDLIFEAVRAFEAKKVAIQENDFYTPELPGIKELVLFVDEHWLGGE